MTIAPQRFLVVEDDPIFSRILTRSLRKRGFETILASGSDEALANALALPPDFVVLDLKLGDRSSLPLIQPLLEIRPALRICLLTGFASVATAVEAVKLGAHHYLAKPAHVDEILTCLGIIPGGGGPDAASGVHGQVPLAEAEWRHIVRALREYRGNVSKAARMLGMHRRTLQRKIAARGNKEIVSILKKLRLRAEREDAAGERPRHKLRQPADRGLGGCLPTCRCDDMSQEK
ncbi:MAG: response regulator [Rhodocyclaceae bacterium]|nr:response regulator [Rhodocyclaceae bacterium]